MSPAESRLNLDALRAPSRKVVFLGVEFELGYIPAGASIPLTEGYNRLLAEQTAAMGSLDTTEAQEAFKQEHAQELAEANIGFVSKFCSFFDSSFTRERVATEATRAMVDMFFVEIIRALMEAANTGAAGDGEKKKP